MARRFTASETQLRPDARFQDKILSRFINCVMQGGEKATATRVVYGAFDEIQNRLDKDKNEAMPRTSIEVFHKALENVRPVVEVRSKRVGGANYQVPVEVRPVRRLALSMRWLKEAAKKRGEKSMALRLANELMEATEGRGGAMKKRDEVHRMAEANKAFSHFRF